MPHVPVLLKEAIEYLNPQPGDFIIDGTVGSAGHAVEILKRILPNGRLLGIDWDKNSLESARLRIKKEFEKNSRGSFEKDSKVMLVHGNYANLPKILEELRVKDPSIPLRASGLLLDLGFSSEQLEKSGRGFSFLRDEPLDMRYNFSNPSRMKSNESRIEMTAAGVLGRFTEKDLAEIFWKYGEEKYSRKIAAKIVEERKKKPIKTTVDLVEIILKSLFNKRTSDVQKLTSILGTSDVQKLKIRGRIHPATRVFQALRIYVNDELGNLERLLKNIEKIVKGRTRLRQGFGGQVVIISFHSLEDRLVKNYFRELKEQGKAVLLTKKPVRPSREEMLNNPRSRSAKLRAVIMNHEA